MENDNSIVNAPVTLDDCDREPIHIPGSIQPHGALLAFHREGKLIGWSANAPELLGLSPALGCEATSLSIAEDPAVREILAAGLERVAADDTSPLLIEVELQGQTFDLVVHAYQKRLIAEFELQLYAAEEVSAFVIKAHRAIDRLKRHRSIHGLLALAVEEVRELTGFDRVMAYRFREDDSGDIVAEARAEELAPFLGMRYPASDIPAQARRLYTINTLRLIPDIGYSPVPLIGDEGEAPLDLSHSILRSVSPIHVEYLQNMGVGASMSVSLVAGGRLWGMLACHHRTPHRVPYAVRLACDVMAQVLACNIQGIQAREDAEFSARTSTLRTGIVEAVLHEEDLHAALSQHAEAIQTLLQADALIISQRGKLLCHGDISRELATEIVQALPASSDSLLVHTQVSEWPEELQPRLGKWAGLLAMCFDPGSSGWILGLRVEQVETVRWGGEPVKAIAAGPLGPRLTPRGSFEEWRETVRGKSLPWKPAQLAAARSLHNDLCRGVNTRYSETEEARSQLLAVLGHDLRDPLNSITLATELLKYGGQQDRASQRIVSATGRMQKLIGQLLDFTRIRNGIGLDLKLRQVELTGYLRELVNEANVNHPGAEVTAALLEPLTLSLDPDRFSQVIANLLSNARHHGAPGEPVEVALRRQGQWAEIGVSNVAEPIPETLVSTLFDAYRGRASSNERNRTGLGLGLFIAREIVSGHGGTIRYEYRDPRVVMQVRLPIADEAA